MIIVELKGGIGNQLFQYATAKHLAIKNNSQLKVDTSRLNHASKLGDVHRGFALEALNLQAELARAEEIKQLKQPYGIFSLSQRLFKTKILRQFFIDFVPSILSAKGNLFLDGYYQSPLYFNEIRSTLLAEFTWKNDPTPVTLRYIDQITNSNSVSIHVRREDYAKDPRVLAEFGLCSLQYYTKAIDHINKHLDNPTYFIFSDDIEWVKENLPLNDNWVIVDDKAVTDIDELLLMSKCKHNIVANSSFSWWGAWLNQNPDKLVIAPTPWFNKHKYDKNLIPGTWIQLPK